MKTLALLCIVVCLSTPGLAAAEAFVLSGSPTVISLGTYTTSGYPYPYPNNFPVQGAKWVWNQNWNNSAVGETITFFNSFNLPCACKTLTLYITADDSFSAYINGNFLQSGVGWTTSYTVPIPSKFLNIGQNTFAVVGTNTLPTKAAVIYAIVGV
jgi:hypothetical protein